MKKFLLIALLMSPLFFQSKAHAFVNLVCESLNTPSSGFIMDNAFDCSPIGKHNSDAFYRLEIFGAGALFSGAMTEGFVVTCPDVRERAFGVKKFVNRRGKTKRGVTKFYGLKAEAAVIVGTTAGVVVNRNGGACILAGGSLISFQAGLYGVRMEFTKL